MAIDGQVIREGQRWSTRCGETAKVFGFKPLHEYPWRVEISGEPHSVTNGGFFYNRDNEHDFDLVTLVEDAPAAPIHPPQEHEELTFHEMPGCAPAIGAPGDQPLVDAIAQMNAARESQEDLSHVMDDKPYAVVTPVSDAAAAGVGDVHSDAKGSGARFNTGKPPYELVPLAIISESYLRVDDLDGEAWHAAIALGMLGEFQAGGDVANLYYAMRELGLAQWDQCAHVFGYGKRKYAAHNWCKGMAWSVPIACAARHLLAIIRGETTDPESGHPHSGHVFCNLVMLVSYTMTYPEGDDRPAPGLFARVGDEPDLRSVA